MRLVSHWTSPMPCHPVLSPPLPPNFSSSFLAHHILLRARPWFFLVTLQRTMGSGQDARFCAQCLSLYANWKSDKEMPKRCEYLPDDPWCWTCLLDEGTPTSKCRVATDLEMEVAAPLIQNFRSLAKEIIETKHLVRTCKDLKVSPEPPSPITPEQYR